jgi:hypothetical protein
MTATEIAQRLLSLKKFWAEAVTCMKGKLHLKDGVWLCLLQLCYISKVL